MIRGNILASVAPDRRIELVENLNEWYLPPFEEPDPMALHYTGDMDFGSMSSTTLIASASDAEVIRVFFEDETPSYTLETLAEWGADASWADITGSLVVRANAIVLFNDTESSATMPVPSGSWTLPDGTDPGSTVAIDPFRSVVLVTSGAIPDDPPYYAASGIDWRAEVPTTTVLSESDSTSPDGGVDVDGGPDGDGDPDGGVDVDGGPDAGPGVGESDEGCSCRTSASPLGSGTFWSLFFVLGVIRLMRR